MTGKPKWASSILGPTMPESILERRSTIRNDNGIVDGEEPPAYYTAELGKGKFFPRGCRGMIERIEIYCKDAGADRLALWWSPHPTLGAFGDGKLTPLDTWAWRGIDVQSMWNFDSIYIWVYSCFPGVDWAYDTEKPHDGHGGPYPWSALEDLDIRPYIRIIYSGETPGDVPVSGIVNTIPIPFASSYAQQNNYPLPADNEIAIIAYPGAGYCDYIEAKVGAKTNSHLTYIRVYCDESLAMEQQFADLNARGFTADTPTVSLTKYGVDGECVMLIHKRFEFRRIISLRAYNLPTAQTVTLGGHPTYVQ